MKEKQMTYSFVIFVQNEAILKTDLIKKIFKLLLESQNNSNNKNILIMPFQHMCTIYKSNKNGICSSRALFYATKVA